MFRLSFCFILIVVLPSCGTPYLSHKKACWAAKKAFYNEAGIETIEDYDFVHPSLNITIHEYDPDTKIGFIYLPYTEIRPDQLDAIDALYDSGEAFILYIPPIQLRNDNSSLDAADAVAQVYMEVVDFLEKLRADGHL